MKHRAELGAMASLVLYTVVRFLAAGETLSSYGVDARWFLFWDVVTVPPYVWAIGRLVRNLAATEVTPIRETVGWSAIALSAFLAPYGYLYYAGAGEFPPLAWVLLTVLVVLFAGNALRSVRKRVVLMRLKPAGVDI